MKNIDILWFDEISALNEPVLTFPVIGRISMRQFFILGIAAIISYAMFSSYQTIFSVIPAAIGAILALTKPKVTSSEQMLLSMVLFFMGRRSGEKTSTTKKPKAKSKKVSIASKKLGFADTLVEETQEPEIRTIVVSDLAKPYRFKVKIVDQAGKILKTQKSKIFIDGIYQDTLTTDVNGEIETVIIPKIVGLKKITVTVDDQTEPVFSETIEILTRSENLA